MNSHHQASPQRFTLRISAATGYRIVNRLALRWKPSKWQLVYVSCVCARALTYQVNTLKFSQKQNKYQFRLRHSNCYQNIVFFFKSESLVLSLNKNPIVFKLHLRELSHLLSHGKRPVCNVSTEEDNREKLRHFFFLISILSCIFAIVRSAFILRFIDMIIFTLYSASNKLIFFHLCRRNN